MGDSTFLPLQVSRTCVHVEAHGLTLSSKLLTLSPFESALPASLAKGLS